MVHYLKSLKYWADCAATDIEIAQAIFDIANGRYDLTDRIWQDPTAAAEKQVREKLVAAGYSGTFN